MDKPDKIPENSMSIQLVLKDDTMDIGVMHNFAEDLPEEERIFYTDALNGLVAQLNTGLETMAFTGMLLRQLTELEEDDGGGIDFEAAPELLEAIAENKVIKFKKKLH